MFGRSYSFDTMKPLEPVVCRNADEVWALARRVHQRKQAHRARMPLASAAPAKIIIRSIPLPAIDHEKACRKVILQFWRAPNLHKQRMSFKEILREVANKHGVSVNDITGPRRILRFVRARHEAMYRLRTEIPNASLPWIGEKLGGRDHTTVLSGLRAYVRRMNLVAERSVS